MQDSDSIYSEQDIQDYAYGSYPGDISAFKSFLHKNPLALQKVREYQDLFKLLKIQAAPSISIDLENRIMEKIFQKKHKKSSAFYQSLPYLLIIFCVVALYIVFNYFYSTLNLPTKTDYNLLLFGGIGMLSFISGFYLIEVKQQQKRFDLYYQDRDSLNQTF